MKKDILNIIEKYISAIIEDKFHRYKSWDNCFHAFSANKQNEIQVLELAFYLASWGMYRGSGGLLQKNHLVHKEAVGITFNKKYQKLKCSLNNEIGQENISTILELKNELKNHYSSISFTKGANESKPISPTDTLLSKIMLGTLACVPAYDRYFIDGLKEMKMKHYTFSKDSLIEILEFANDNKQDIKAAQKLIKIKTGNHYPIMKIIDMYFWQIGYDKELKDKKRNKK